MKKLKNLVPAFAMALAVLGAFAFTANGSTEEVANIGWYDADGDPTNECETQFDCGPEGNTPCTENITGFQLPVFENTNCTNQLKMLP